MMFGLVSKFPLLNLFLANDLILYSLKTPENKRFSGVFRGYKMGTLAKIGFNILRNGLCFMACNDQFQITDKGELNV